MRRILKQRTRPLVAVVAALGLLAASGCETAPAEFATTYGLIDESRSAEGLAPLAGQVDLIIEADRWAQHMRDTCTLAHRPNLWVGTPDGAVRVAENVGVVPHVTEDPTDAMEWMHDGFMGSSGHRSNILHGSMTHVGVGAVLGSCGTTGAPNEYWVVHVFIEQS